MGTNRKMRQRKEETGNTEGTKTTITNYDQDMNQNTRTQKPRTMTKVLQCEETPRGTSLVGAN